MEYLKDKQDYIDRYDLFTIKQCLEVVEFWRKAYKKHLTDKEAEKFSAGDKAKGFNWITNQELYIIKAGRYQRKEETIEKWILEDKQKQEKYDTTHQPQRILCPDCKKPMLSSLKHLESFDEPMRMMFLFNCSSCKKKRWIYENGTERESTPSLCPKCKAEATVSLVKEGKKKVIWKTDCPSCGFTETTVDDFEKSRAEWKKQQDEEKKLLETHRETFCKDEEGKKSFEYIEALKVANVVFDEEVKKFDSLAYQKVSRLKKLSIIELEKLLHETVEKEHYSKLSFDKPEIGKHIIVPFNLQDADSSRKEEISISNLQKHIKETLDGTNWRLMSDRLSYRLGFISGRLKGYEREEDFFELSGEKKEEKPSKLDYETRTKYEGHNVVQLARFMGEFKGIESVRKRRLTKDPEGFFLESSEDIYTCGICGDPTPGNKAWWNLDGIRCADCQRNIKESVIPSEIHKNDEIWLKDWQLSSDFNVRGSTAKKLRKEGILHGRELKRENGTVYFTVYLNSENKEFLKKYPRNKKQRMIITDLLGNKIEL